MEKIIEFYKKLLKVVKLKTSRGGGLGWGGGGGGGGGGGVGLGGWGQIAQRVIFVVDWLM